ncbi:MAG TPA: FHA domain-containing protein, partial [Planctomycetota bacterium]|nr:FHA domain-containing protein [Planctomycetota bacterium]
LSSIHATFARSGQRWYVQDHFSKNGTVVNGEVLGPGALRRLSDGDTIGFANVLRTRFFGPQGLYDFLSLIHRVAPSQSNQG